MSLKSSTGFRNAICVTGSAKATLDGGFLKLYAGTVPTDADAALGSATLLATVTVNDDGTTGLTFSGTATGGSLSKNSDVWAGSGVVDGDTTFWRFVKTGDTGASSTTAVRIQGSAASGSLIMDDLHVTTGTPKTISFCQFAFPGG